MKVVHDANRHRFVAIGDDGEGFLSYHLIAPGRIELDYVEVLPRYRGQGVAGQIVAAACVHARGEGARVIPTCPYIAWWIRHHPEYHDLLETQDRA